MMHHGNGSVYKTQFVKMFLVEEKNQCIPNLTPQCSGKTSPIFCVSYGFQNMKII